MKVGGPTGPSVDGKPRKGPFVSHNAGRNVVGVGCTANARGRTPAGRCRSRQGEPALRSRHTHGSSQKAGATRKHTHRGGGAGEQASSQRLGHGHTGHLEEWAGAGKGKGGREAREPPHIKGGTVSTSAAAQPRPRGLQLPGRPPHATAPHTHTALIHTCGEVGHPRAAPRRHSGATAARTLTWQGTNGVTQTTRAPRGGHLYPRPNPRPHAQYHKGIQLTPQRACGGSELRQLVA
jgi:hypothetical protein